MARPCWGSDLKKQTFRENVKAQDLIIKDSPNGLPCVILSMYRTAADINVFIDEGELAVKVAGDESQPEVPSHIHAAGREDWPSSATPDQ